MPKTALISKDKELKELKQYFSYLEKERKHWENGVWKDTAENLFPYREDFTGTEPKGTRVAQKIYNSAPMTYLNTFAEGFHGNMIPKGLMWFALRLPAQFKFLEEVPEVRQWLQETQEALYYFLGESNFYTVMRPYLKDGGSIGTAYLTCEEDLNDGKLNFLCLHPRECYIGENEFSKVDILFRKFPFTARNIERKFGTENLSDSVMQSLRNNPFTEHDIIHAVYPNDEFNKAKLGVQFKQFTSRYFESKAADDGVFLRAKGYTNFPYFVWRYLRGNKGPYGDSPTTFALPEIMGLQTMGKTLLRSGEIASDPAHNIPSEMAGDADTGPGGNNYFGPDFNRKITPIQSGMNYPITQDRENKREEILKRHYHVNYFLALEQTKRQMTAEESRDRKSEAMLMSASVGDISTTLDSVIDYVFNLKRTSGEIRQPPDILREYMGGMRIPIEYMGRLVQEQKRLFETRGIIDSLDVAGPYIQMFPESADIIEKDETLKQLLVSFGFPQTNFNPKEVVQQIREGRTALREEEKKKIDAAQMADVLKALAQAHKNSPELFEQMKAAMGGAGETAGIGMEAIA